MSSHLPPADGPEYLHDQGGEPSRDHRSGGGGRRTGVIAAGALVGVAALGGGIAFGWNAFFATGAQPAEALPASTIGYVSIDLDPSGSQKLAALRTLQKFPAFEEELGLDTDDDLRREIFDEIQSDTDCDGLDYADDVEPWLGNRFGIGAVDTGEDIPSFVVVVQVSDEAAAEDGFAAVQECATGGEESGVGGWAIRDGWAVVAETDEIAEQVSDDAADEPLSEDGDFRDWTGQAGDPGILTAYASPDAAAALTEALSGFPFGGGEICIGAPDVVPFDPEAGPGEDPFESGPEDFDCEVQPGGDASEQVDRLAKDFEGAALTVRFDDGSLELETATGAGGFGFDGFLTSDQGAEAISTLPEDTAAALGIGFEDGWFDEALTIVAESSGLDVDLDEFIEQAEAETGLSLPEDAETLAGESAALALSNDFDIEEFIESDGPAGLPFALKIKGDGDEIEAVLDKVRASLGEEDVATLINPAADGDYTVISPDDDYRDEALEDGDLGGSDVFEDVVREADRASALLFVNFDAGGGWLDSLAGDDDEVAQNLEPLAGAGISAWVDDDVAHTVIRVTTD